MSTAPVHPLVPVDEYLNSSYRPDVEYVDGVLVERGMPTVLHSLLQQILSEYFRRLEREYNFKTFIELRTQIIERARYRIPDVLLAARPIPASKIMTAVPDVAIEVLSPDDRMSDIIQRYRDFTRVGVQTIVQMDPEDHVAHRFENGSLIETQFTHLTLRSGATIPFDSAAIFDQLRAEYEEATRE